MLSKLFSRLKSIFVPMPSPRDSPSYESPQARFLPFIGIPQDIKGYIRHIICQIQSGNGPEWVALSQHRVVKLEYCKNLAEGHKPEHEFLVATVVDDTNTFFRLQIERVVCPNAVTLTPVEPEETTGGFLAILRSEQPSRAKESTECAAAPRSTAFPPLAYVAAIRAALPSLASQSVASLNSTASAVSASSQSLIASPEPAYDKILRLRASEVYSSGVTILRSYVPMKDSLSLLHLAMIIEAVHDCQPVYQVLTANCYWFAMMIMGICMLQGGHVRVVGKNTPAGKEPPQVFIEPHTSSEPVMPDELQPIPVANEDEIEVKMPIPTPNKDDIQVITKGAGAGKKKILFFGSWAIVKASFQDIWRVGRASQDHYDVIYGYLKNRKSIQELLREKEEMRIQIEERDKDAKDMRIQIEERDKQMRIQLAVNAEHQKKIEALERQVGALSIGSAQLAQAGHVASLNGSHVENPGRIEF